MASNDPYVADMCCFLETHSEQISLRPTLMMLKLWRTTENTRPGPVH